jgi:hypothetical protein
MPSRVSKVAQRLADLLPSHNTTADGEDEDLGAQTIVLTINSNYPRGDVRLWQSRINSLNVQSIDRALDFYLQTVDLSACKRKNRPENSTAHPADVGTSDPHVAIERSACDIFSPDSKEGKDIRIKLSAFLDRTYLTRKALDPLIRACWDGTAVSSKSSPATAPRVLELRFVQADAERRNDAAVLAELSTLNPSARTARSIRWLRDGKRTCEQATTSLRQTPSTWQETISLATQHYFIDCPVSIATTLYDIYQHQTRSVKPAATSSLWNSKNPSTKSTLGSQLWYWVSRGARPPELPPREVRESPSVTIDLEQLRDLTSVLDSLNCVDTQSQGTSSFGDLYPKNDSFFGRLASYVARG